MSTRLLIVCVLSISSLIAQESISLPAEDRLLQLVEDSYNAHQQASLWAHGGDLPSGRALGLVNCTFTIGGSGTVKYPIGDPLCALRRRGSVKIQAVHEMPGVQVGDELAFEFGQRFPSDPPDKVDWLNRRGGQVVHDDPLTPGRLIIFRLDHQVDGALEKRIKDVMPLPPAWHADISGALKVSLSNRRAYATNMPPASEKPLLLEHLHSENQVLSLMAMLRLLEAEWIDGKLLAEWVQDTQKPMRRTHLAIAVLQQHSPAQEKLFIDMVNDTKAGDKLCDFAIGALGLLRKIEPDYFENVLALRAQKLPLTSERVAPQAASIWRLLQKLHVSISANPIEKSYTELRDIIFFKSLLME